MNPKFLYFDLGNVLVTFCNDRMVRQMAAVAEVDEGVVRAALLPTGTPDDPQWRFECGQFSPDEYYRQFCDAIGAEPPRAELELACSDIFGPIEESLQLMTRLAAAGHRLGILSNTNAVHWPFLTDGRFPEVNDAFELHVTSFDAGAMKPDRRIYQYAADRAGVALEELFFADDREDNVAGRWRRGWTPCGLYRPGNWRATSANGASSGIRRAGGVSPVVLAPGSQPLLLRRNPKTLAGAFLSPITGGWLACLRPRASRKFAYTRGLTPPARL